MKNIFKNLNKSGLVALAIAGFFTISWTEVKKNSDDPQWYEVEDHGFPLGQPANQEIKGLYPNQEPGTECQEDDGKICAIQLTFNPATTDMPETVADANSDLDVTVGPSRFSDED